MLLSPERVVYTGAKIITMSPSMPEAEAVCVSGGRIECLGSRADVLRHAAQGPHNVVDLGGGTLYPGFIDTHSHLSMYASCLDWAHCGAELGSIAAVQTLLREQAARRSSDWVLGYGYDDTGISDNRHLTRQDLDAVCTDRPVGVQHISAHFCSVNTAGLRLLGITADTRIPGGEIFLGEDGEPNGILAENAAFLFMSALPQPNLEDMRANLLRAVADYNKQGFTTFQDGGIGISGEADTVMQAYTGLAREGRLNARAYLHMMPNFMEKLLPYGLWGLTANDTLTLGGLKYFTDGSIQGFTAALKEDYHTRPGHKGELVFPPETIDAMILKHHCAGMQVAVHGNGDAGIEVALSGFEKAQAACPRSNPRHMIVHAQTASDAQLERMQRCGVIPTFFSRHIEVWGDRHHDLFLGPERAARLNPAGTCVRLGMPFALHVDSPVLPVTALHSMHAAVNRITSGGRLLGPDQRISPLEALRAYTTYASLCCGGELDRGCIEPGRFADFVLLSDDMLSVSPDTINTLEVRKTICGGRIVYEA